jgi:SAM-dependent methyltransferase
MTTVLENNSHQESVSTPQSITSQAAPSRSDALQQYGARAPIYDLQAAPTEPLRKQAIDRLSLNPGGTVIDAGCGTGLSFAALEEAVGQQGAIIGIEQSPSMMEQARRRVARHGWHNLTLLNAPVEEAVLSIKADAALFCFTHDIMRRREAVKNVVNHLKPGARVVSVGLKWAEAPGLLAVNMMVWSAAMWSTTTLEGLSSPWSHLEDLVGELWVEEFQPGAFYIATGIVPD